MTNSALPILDGCDNKIRARLTTWLVDQRRSGVELPDITTATIAMLKATRPLAARVRADRLLEFLSVQSEHLGEGVPFAYGEGIALEMLAWSESVSDQELDYLLKILVDDHCIDDSSVMGGGEVTVLVGGLERLDRLLGQAARSTQGFVAMWFSDTMTPAYVDGIAPAIRDAGYSPMRIDGKQHNNKIDDEIIAEIRRSRFLVADFTFGEGGPRGGVYYEAGFAHGLSIPVIFTIRVDKINEAHFDTRQYSHILWKEPSDLRKQLADRISATIGDGPLKRLVS